jgi:hypothetical protein
MKACMEVCKLWTDANQDTVNHIDAASFSNLSPAQKIKVVDYLRKVQQSVSI